MRLSDWPGWESLGVRDIPAEEAEQLYADEDSRFMEVEGARVHYKDEGVSDGPPLVMFHGTFASLHTWDGWVRELADRYRLIRLDLPSFGLTGPLREGQFSAPRMVRLVDEFAGRLGLASFHLAGSSLGGYFAWRYAAERPERVERLVLVDAAGYPMKLPPILKFIATPVLGEGYRYFSPRFLVKANIKQVYADGGKVEEPVVDRYHRLMLREGNRRSLMENLPRLSKFDDHPYVKSVQSPTLVMWGEEDSWVPPEIARKFMRDLPDARLVTYPGVGHVPMEEIPRRSAADVDEFLSAVAAQSAEKEA